MSELVAARSLVDLEATIERGLMHFMEVGSALLEIRERQLYRATHRTWNAYVNERWGFGEDRAGQLIMASEIVKQLPTTVGVHLPINERQTRELARIPDPAERAEVWQTAVDRHGGRVTAAAIHEIRHEESPSYDSSPIIDLPDIQPIPKTAKVFEQLIRMSTVTQDAPDAVADAAIRYHASSARNYLSRADAVLTWHAQFVAALRKRLETPLRAMK